MFMKSAAIAATVALGCVLAACDRKAEIATAPAPAPVAVSASPAAASIPDFETSLTALSGEIPAGIRGLEFVLGGKCAIDMINGISQTEVVSIDRTGAMAVEGWAFDDVAVNVPPELVLQLVDGEQRYYGVLTRRGERDDLSQAFGNAVFSQAGYAGLIDIASLPPAQYDVLVIQKQSHKNLVCPTYRKLTISR
jgi:hypothetical protein